MTQQAAMPSSISDLAAICAKLSTTVRPTDMLEEVAQISASEGFCRVSLIDDVLVDSPVTDDAGQRLVEGIFGWPSGLTNWWYGRRLNSSYVDSRRCLSERHPFPSQLYASPLSDDTNTELRKRLDDMGFGNACIVPVHLPRGKTSMVSFNTAEKDLAERLEQKGYLLHLLAYACIDAVERLNGQSQAETFASLSARQAECVRWAALGKTAKETARLTSLSPHTVEDYLRSAAERLNVRGKTQLIAVALRNGLI